MTCDPNSRRGRQNNSGLIISKKEARGEVNYCSCSRSQRLPSAIFKLLLLRIHSQSRDGTASCIVCKYVCWRSWSCGFWRRSPCDRQFFSAVVFRIRQNHYNRTLLLAVHVEKYAILDPSCQQPHIPAFSVGGGQVRMAELFVSVGKLANKP